MHDGPTGDRRVRRTQRQLRDALASLIREKPYDAIAVREILDRADVGRSTFYTHFADKDELLVSGIQEIIRARRPERTRAAPHDRLIWFSRPVLEHIAEHRQLGADGMGRRGRAVLHRYLRRTLREEVADRLRRDPESLGASATIPRGLVAEYVVSTFVLVLEWWVESGTALGPDEADQLFRSLVLPALAPTAPA